MNTPDVVTRYLRAADRKDPAGVAACFTPDGTVTDEGMTHHGRDEIAGWREKTISQWIYTTTVTGTERDGEEIRVRMRLEGNFPGGVADLTNRFRLEGDLIKELTIG